MESYEIDYTASGNGYSKNTSSLNKDYYKEDYKGINNHENNNR